MFEHRQQLLAAALQYAEKGWQVFPAPRGTKKSHKSADHSNGSKWGKSADQKQIKRDFTKWPEANVGVATGPESGFWVLETDTIAGGHTADGAASLSTLEQQHGQLPDTRTSQSPTGSKHRYFKYPQDRVIKNSANRIGPGIDVRGDGGMVIAPPSVTDKGSYVWISNAELAEAPEWLLKLASEPERDCRYETTDRDLTADEMRIAAAVKAIPNNDMNWEEWNKIGMAIFSATSGSEGGLNIFLELSSRSAKFNEAKTTDKWREYKKSPPDRIGAGTLFFLADTLLPSSDEAIALRFAARHGHDVRFVALWSRWMLYTGTHWCFDDTLAAFNRARALKASSIFIPVSYAHTSLKTT